MLDELISDHAAAKPGCDEVLCWSRMQSEAGQGLNRIIARKEVERRTGGGLFMWGVGNAPGVTAARLVSIAQEPIDVVFSIMKGPPRAVDAHAASIVAWRQYVTSDGDERRLPPHCVVTSRAKDFAAGQPRHYALICRSEVVLELGDHGAFDPGDFRNAGGNGGPVGASQVTAMLRRIGNTGRGAYRINMRARFDCGAWVRLSDPVPVERAKLAELDKITTATSGDEWLDFAARIRDEPSRREWTIPYQRALL